MSSERNKRSFREIPTISEAKVSERAYAESPEQAQKELEESVRDFTQKTHEEVNRLRREIGKGKSIPGLSQDSVDWSTFASGWHGAKIDKLQDKVSQLPNSPVRTQLQELLTDIQDGSLDEKIPEAVTTTEQEPWKKMTLDQVKNMLEIDRPGVMENLTYHPGVEHFRTNEGVVISDDDGPRP